MNDLLSGKKLKRPSYPITPRKVAVLMGGWSPERPVSLTSGKGVCGALQTLGHQVFPVDPERDLEAFASQLKTCAMGGKPDVVFNILHGPPGENGVIQSVLELLGVPYTFSGVLASALAMDKGKSRSIARAAGLRCPQGVILSKQAYQQEGVSFFPHVVKPLQEGSTVGVTWVGTPQEQQAALRDWAFGEKILVESYVPGREIQVAVLNGKALGAVEIRFEGPIFSYEAKYVQGKAQHLIPAPMDPVSYEAALEMAETIHAALGCAGATRSDFRYDDTKGEPGTLYYLETNTQPGMTPLSLVPEIAAYLGWSYEDLVQWIVEDGLCRN
ncbi:MAG: D-alanine--D-alanine ligase [Alphaproteobacteria bacterium]